MKTKINFKLILLQKWTKFRNLIHSSYKTFREKSIVLTILELTKNKRFYIYLILYTYISIYSFISIFNSFDDWDIKNTKNSNLFNFISAIATICGSIAALYHFLISSIRDIVLRNILSEKIHELIYQSTIKQNQKIEIYLSERRYKKSAKILIDSFRNDLIEQRNDFTFSFEQTLKLAYRIKKETGINEEEYFALLLQFYSDYYWFWDEFAEFFKKSILKEEKVIREGIWLFLQSKDTSLNINEKKEIINNYLQDTFNSKENKFERLIDAETTLSDSDLLSHVISNTYIQADYKPDVNIKAHKGPVLLIKNEEKFSSWWKKMDDIISTQLIKNGEISNEEIENFSAREYLDKKKKGIVTQPFYTALKESKIINNFLEYLRQSPVFYFDTRDLPPEFSGNPKTYITRVLKPIATRQHNNLVKFIQKELKIKSIPKKDTVLNYQLIPFQSEHMVIKVDSEDYPKPIQKILISSMLSYDQKKRLIRSHIIETKKFIKEVTPFSLLAKSISIEKISELKKAENQLLKELSLSKNGNINLKGIDSIVTYEKDIELLLNILYNKAKAMKIRIKKSELKTALKEIFGNARRIKEKID
ncbi:hypothetical protein [Leptospira meyeri]|uniref:hypothetical protein n=1 Tax=Leptospira meyeri TaxID=29508 RepID=UPI0002BE2A5F|nr:hypothetical protein [Leptospira meyeri]EMJ87228.1 hypothetical protein LEP1GSC196_2613 [Leptospira meyeri serovar Semaranga str. Veldrot Semarang 173]